MNSAYVNGIANLASDLSDGKLDSIYLEKLTGCYFPDGFELETVDVEEEINQGLFRIFFNEAKDNNIFSNEKVIDFFKDILYFNGKYVGEVLDILFLYTSKHALPEAIVMSVENLLSFPNYFENVIRSYKILSLLENYL